MNNKLYPTFLPSVIFAAIAVVGLMADLGSRPELVACEKKLLSILPDEANYVRTGYRVVAYSLEKLVIHINVFRPDQGLATCRLRWDEKQFTIYDLYIQYSRDRSRPKTIPD